MKVQEAYRTPNRLDQKKTSPRHIVIKTQSIQTKERILKAAKEKGQVTYKGKPIRLTPDFSMETMKARRSWIEVLQKLRDNGCKPRLLYPAKLLFTINGENKIFQYKNKFKQYVATNPALQRIQEGKELQLKGPEKIFNKIIEENFPNLKNYIPMKVQEAYRTPNRPDQKKKTSPHYIIIKTQNIQIKERILRAAKEKSQVTYI